MNRFAPRGIPWNNDPIVDRLRQRRFRHHRDDHCAGLNARAKAMVDGAERKEPRAQIGGSPAISIFQYFMVDGQVFCEVVQCCSYTPNLKIFFLGLARELDMPERVIGSVEREAEAGPSDEVDEEAIFAEEDYRAGSACVISNPELILLVSKSIWRGEEIAAYCESH